MEKAEGTTVTVRLDTVIGLMAVAIAVLGACCAGLAVSSVALLHESRGYERAAAECHDSRIVAEAKVDQMKDWLEVAAKGGGKGGPH